MGDSHRHLQITEEEWRAFMDDFAQSLNKFGVPETEEQELTAIVEGTHDEIVISPPAEQPAPTGSEPVARAGL